MESIDDWLDWNTLYYRLEIGQACYLIILILLDVYFIAKFVRISTVHQNFRVLFSVLVIQYNVINVSRLLVHAVYYLTHDWKERTLPNIFCIFLSPFYSSALIISAITVFSLGLERLIATTRRHKYEHQNASVAITLLVGKIFLGLALAFGFLFYQTMITNDFDIDTSVDSCLSTERYPSLMTFVWIFAGLTYITGLVFFIWLNKRTKYLITHPSDNVSFSLTVRNQLFENLATTGLVVPSIGLYGLILLVGIPVICLTQIYLLNGGREGQDIVVLTVHQILLMTFDFYSFTFTILAMLRFRPLSSQIKKDLRHLFCVNEVQTRPNLILPTCEDKTNLYFQHLTHSWNKTFNERKMNRFIH